MNDFSTTRALCSRTISQWWIHLITTACKVIRAIIYEGIREVIREGIHAVIREAICFRYEALLGYEGVYLCMSFEFHHQMFLHACCVNTKNVFGDVETHENTYYLEGLVFWIIQSWVLETLSLLIPSSFLPHLNHLPKQLLYWSSSPSLF